MAKQAQVAVGREGTKKPVLIGIGIVVILIVIVGGFLLLKKPGQTAGKAIEVTEVTSTSTLDELVKSGTKSGSMPLLLTKPIKTGDILTIPIWIYADEDSVEYSVRVKFDPKQVKFVAGDSLMTKDWGNDFLSVTENTDQQGMGLAQIHDGTIDFTNSLKKGKTYQVAEFKFQALQDIPLSDISNAQVMSSLLSIQFIQLFAIADATVDLLDKSTFLQPYGKIACSSCTLDVVTQFTADQLATKLTDQQVKDLCALKKVCTVNADGSVAFSVNINGDKDKAGKDIINGQDAFIILKIAEAQVSVCGTDAPCKFDATLTCDDGSFRVDGYHGYVYNPADKCSDFKDMVAYVKGGQ